MDEAKVEREKIGRRERGNKTGRKMGSTLVSGEGHFPLK